MEYAPSQCAASLDPRWTRAADALLRWRPPWCTEVPGRHGLYVDPDCALSLSARRLSIIDVAGGHQPVANEDGSVWAILNGEVYNHGALRSRLRERGHAFTSETDTEVLVHLYEDYGPALVHAIEGMYAFAIGTAELAASCSSGIALARSLSFTPSATTGFCLLPS